MNYCQSCGLPSKPSIQTCPCGYSFTSKNTTTSRAAQPTIKPIKKELTLEQLLKLDDIPYDYVGEYDFSALGEIIEEQANELYKK